LVIDTAETTSIAGMLTRSRSVWAEFQEFLEPLMDFANGRNL
jgi:hypothetical protein